jgi:diguanylate cyclase (GGDEF)-like protein
MLLLVCAGVLYVAVTLAWFVFEAPGLGVGHFYYVPIALTALATDAFVGIGGGLLATALYILAIYFTSRLPTRDVATAASAIRLVTFCSIGGIIGWFASANRDLVTRLREQASRDFLTGISNARAFDEELARRCRAGRPFALVLGDMDNLKEINDTHGHAAGNGALARAAEILQRTVPKGTCLARIGGDEFALVLSGGTDEAAAWTADAQRALGDELEMSFGSCLFPTDGVGPVELFRKADDRLYAAKLLRRNRQTVLAVAASK